jgi:hypothetical protein
MADYAISNVPRRVVYAPSGVGPYAFTFEILDQTDIAVYKGSTLLTLTTDYTVTINLNGTGSVTLVATAGTDNITIVGAKNIQRTSDFTTGGDLFADTLNDELDNQTIFIQQVAETAERGLKAPVVDPTDINMTLPSKTARAGTFLAFDSPSGNPIAGPEIASVGTVTQNIANINTVAADIANVNTTATNITNVNTVAGISGNVTTVAGISANVTSVAGNASNINTVAGSISNVNATGSNIASVNAVAGELGAGQDVTVVAADLTGADNIGIVAGSITDINALGPIAADIATVAGIDSDVTAVAADATDIGTVAGIAANVTTVAGISANVTSVAGNSTNINTVAGISANVTTVATNNANVTTVAGSIANVNTNATNIANINQNAANIVAIQNASANATAAASSATAAAGSATSASASAAAASAVALGNEPVRHSVRPSLLLDFANTKTLDPRITFTRASTATFYDGKTVAKAEENLAVRSQEFDNAYWGTIGLTKSANSTTAPDSTSTADSITETAVSSSHSIFPAGATAVVLVTSATYTVSCFVKPNGRDFVSLVLGSYNTQSRYARAVFDVAGGTVTATGNTGSTTYVGSSITSAGNGWYRVSLTASLNTGTDGYVSIGCSDSGTPTVTTFGDPNYLGDITKGLFLWGAQLEQRSAVTAYTATTTAPITNYIPALQSAASGVARFEHNPITGESLGLEIEEQRTNLVTYSDDFSNAAWTKAQSTITSNTIVAPDGTLTGDKLVENTATAAHAVQRTGITITSGISYTLSVYAKAAERTLIQLQYFDGTTNRFPIFSLVDGTKVVDNGIGTNFTSTNVGNGWWRFTITMTSASTAAQVFIYPALVNTNSYAGDGYSGIYIWGAQLEAGAFATSYIPTVASQVTRSADVATMTGSNFSSWFRQDEGTLYAESRGLSDSVGNVSNGLSIGLSSSGGNAMALGVDTRTPQNAFFNVLNNSVVTAGPSVATTMLGASRKLAGAYAVNNVIMATGGTLATVDTSTAIPVCNQLSIGVYPPNTALFDNGYVSKIAYYPKRLQNEELQSLTTI